jgi:hypothetical protein
MNSETTAKPDRIGKYFSLRDPRRIYSVVMQDRLYFANPGDFNDPFEFNAALYRPRVFTPVTQAGKRIRALTQTQKFQEVERKQFEDIRTNQQNRMKKLGVCCFTQSLESILMWTHYADNHQGMCLVFDTKYKFFDGIRKVNYLPKRLEMPLFEKKLPNRLLEIMISKLDLWSYEKEWRLFRRYANRKYKYPHHALRGIIFGYRCISEDRDLVLKLTHKREIAYYKARLSQYEYKLEITDLTL